VGIVDPNINRAHESNVDDMDIDPDNLNDSLEDSLKESNVTEL
jgi:hypothetical protein